MRRSVFLAVWLSLVLSLLKGTTAETAPDAIESRISETTETSPVDETPADTTEMPTSEPTGITAETTPDAIETTISETTETSPVDETPADTTEMPTSEPTGITAETTPDAIETTISETTVSSPVDETPPDTTEMSTSEPTESSTVHGTTSTTTVSTTSKPIVLGDFCHEDPCGRNFAKCISLNTTFICECPYGFYYNEKNCYRGQVYPGTFRVKGSYSDSVQIVNSTEYEELFNSLSAFFKKALQNLPGHEQTVIVEIQLLKDSRESFPLNVTVTNLFKEDSPANKSSVLSAVQLAINNTGENQSFVSFYEEVNHCDIYQCDTQTTKCEGDMFPVCNCKADLEKTQWDDRSCSACSKNCSAKAHKYCVKENGVPECKCMSNFKKRNGKCVACPVGYSGENCSNNSELILIIVGTVFGAIILSLVVAVSVVSVRARHKRNPEKKSLIKSGYSDIDSDDRPSMFPRVQTTSGHANPGYQPNNPYEMDSTNRGHFPERDYDDLYEASREPGGFRMQRRY